MTDEAFWLPGGSVFVVLPGKDEKDDNEGTGSLRVVTAEEIREDESSTGSVIVEHAVEEQAQNSV